MAKVTLTTIQGAYASVTELNANFVALAAALELAVFTDGTTPNSMDADFDMGGYDLMNVGNISLYANTHLQLPTSTSTALDDVADAINTAAAKAAGACVFNTTVNKPVYAVGSADADIWVDGSGNTINTPIA